MSADSVIGCPSPSFFFLPFFLLFLLPLLFLSTYSYIVLPYLVYIHRALLQLSSLTTSHQLSVTSNKVSLSNIGSVQCRLRPHQFGELDISTMHHLNFITFLSFATAFSSLPPRSPLHLIAHVTIDHSLTPSTIILLRWSCCKL